MSDVEQQIERAMTAINGIRGTTLLEINDGTKKIMRDLLAGKFKEEPLPSINPPPWPHDRLYASAEPGTNGQECYVYCTGSDWGLVRGPCRSNCRAAIAAWNTVFK